LKVSWLGGFSDGPQLPLAAAGSEAHFDRDAV
jgi:hypothetical protein